MDQNIKDITYSIIDGKATVTGFIGEPSFIVVPPEIEGCPVTEIRDNAFYECVSLKQIILPDSLERMGHHCFFGCTALESADLPVNVKEIGMGCFCRCTSLSYATLPKKIKRIPDSCFRSCAALTEITIPSGVKAIEKFAFCGCTALSSVNMDSALLSIGDYAFFMCDSLTEMYVPASVKTFGNEAIGFDSDGSRHSLTEDFAMAVEYGSPAEQYAADNSMEYRYVSGENNEFSLHDSSNAPIEIPDAFGIAGSVLLAAAITSVMFRRKRRYKRRRF
ncbi:MAG: leucine-rich repeat domain-containing protein [Ruminococcus sp.]|nr:leucine-rich repeat domain-containing protein [Ruminococcus sp.]